jgi:hypothetical protein
MEDTCIVITGLIKREYMEHLKQTYINIKNKIISTWEDQNKDLIKELESMGFIVILNSYPEHKNSTNYQSKCIKEGCIKAKELGFKYVGRMRSDICCNDMPLFIDAISHLYKEKICCLSGIWRPTTGYYILDVLLFGDVNSLIKLVFNEQKKEDSRFVEKYWLESYIGKTDLDIADIKEHFNFCLIHARNKNITMFWRNHNVELIRNYCNGDFILL